MNDAKTPSAVGPAPNEAPPTPAAAGAAAPGFCFLFTPNNSGSTVISQYIAAQIGGYLPPFGNNEGQMAPAVRAMMRRRPWRRDTVFDWGAIRSAWEALRDEAGAAVFVEASPPNLVRVDHIVAAFGGDARYLMSVSNPYLFIGSRLYNYGAPPMSEAAPAAAARAWIKRARFVRRWRAAYPAMPLVTYEGFCADPASVNAALGLPVRPTPALAGKATTGERRIRDMTAAAIGFLTAPELDRASEALAEAAEDMAALGYETTPGDALLSAAEAAAPDLLARGLDRRAGWADHAARRGPKAPPAG